jgi:branched-chain amino acid transport system permease protein
VDQLIAYTVIGLTTGAIYAVAASGLVVTYTTSGIFNFAHGATGMLAAFTYWQFRFGWGWPAPLALLVVLGVIAPAFGAAIERLALRNLRDTAEVVKVTVTVGLLAAMIGLATWLWPPATRARFRGFFDGYDVSIGGVNVSWHKLIAFGCAVAVAVGLRLFLYRTRLGISMRAAVDDRNLAQLNGARPAMASMVAWAGSASLAGLAGILLAAEVGLNVVPLTLLVVSAYAAAIVGRLRSLPWTFVGALILGILEAYTLWANGTSWWPQTVGGFATSGLRAALPTIFLFVVLIALPQARLRAGANRLRERAVTPSWRMTILGIVLLVGFVVAISGLLTRSNTTLVSAGLILAIAGLSLVPLTGYAGQLSLAPLTFAGLGAVIMAKLPWGGSVLSLVVTVAIVAAIGALVALPALRLQGIYLALATGAFAIMVTTLVFSQQRVFTGGAVTVPPLDLPGVDLTEPTQKMIFLSVAFSALAAVVVGLRRSRLGRRMVAMKDSPLAGATIGMNLTGTKLAAFAISAAIAALAGALNTGKVVADQYTFDQSLPLVLLVVVGGVSAVSGALFGGVLLGLNTLLGVIVPTLKNLTKVLPGLVGISLGRNPDGAVPQIEERFAPVGQHLPSLVVAIAGGVVLRLLTGAGLVSNWSFAIGVIVWTLGVVPNLPSLLSGEVPARQRLVGLAWVVAMMVVAAGVDWGSVLGASGWRLVVAILLIAVGGLSARAALDTTPRISAESPDLVGLDRDFTPAEISEAERYVGAIR